ncbi:uncharacterized protein LOC114281984 [Camellia sinensis]|uniref:uncharacterized protein LOC114281984 n=1 Tax=Camellia sinensis TaxID=4442 RepID=UPI001035AD64|nr:uncharacterized protein LOC114281984 [Camellia sinensis]
MDDILVTGNSADHITSLIHHMHKAFSMNELGDISYFLGISIARITSGLFLSQPKYATDILYKADLHVFSDSDWANDVLDRKSTIGYCVFLGPNLILWSVKKQSTISRSSTEAEYRAFAQASAELQWIHMLLQELSLSFATLVLWCDNLSAISLASNPIFHALTKNIEVDYHLIQEQVLSHKVMAKLVSSSDQVVDLFTKPLPVAQFSYLLPKLMVHSSPIRLRGSDKSMSPTQAVYPQLKQVEPTN